MQERIGLHTSIAQAFRESLFLNPANNFFRQTFSLSNLSVAGILEDESQAITVEKGTGWRGFQVSMNSYIRLNETSRAWGKAAYRNGEIQNVLWNESSDYDLIYPYVIADTIGGDMKSETYSFAGGYASQKGNWTFGGEVLYRAQIEYRGIDPRPRNVVNDLEARVGANRKTGGQYVIGLSAEARKYKQDGGIKYYNELGSSKAYHLSGLGMSYVRFDGNKFSTHYQGNEFGGSVQLFPVGPKGWSGLFHYRHSHYIKKLPDQNNLPLNLLDKDRIQAEAAYSGHIRNHKWGVRLHGELDTRRGTENIYGEATGSIYPQISEARQFKSDGQSMVLSAFYEHGGYKQWRLSASPDIGYNSRKDSYASPYQYFNYSHLNASLTFNALRMWEKQQLNFCLWALRSRKIDADLNIQEVTTPFAGSVMQQDFRMQSGSHTRFGISAKWVVNILKNVALQSEAGWEHGRYADKVKTDRIWISVGAYL